MKNKNLLKNSGHKLYSSKRAIICVLVDLPLQTNCLDWFEIQFESGILGYIANVTFFLLAITIRTTIKLRTKKQSNYTKEISL